MVDERLEHGDYLRSCAIDCGEGYITELRRIEHVFITVATRAEDVSNYDASRSMTGVNGLGVEKQQQQQQRRQHLCLRVDLYERFYNAEYSIIHFDVRQKQAAKQLFFKKLHSSNKQERT